MDLRGTRPSLLEAVIFDWDGTLADTGEYPTRVADWEPAAEVLQPENPDVLASRLHLVDQQVRDRMAEQHRPVRVEAIIEETARLVGLEPDPDVLAAAIDAHLQGCARRVVADPGALDMLTDLRQAHYRTGLSANTTWPGSFCESLMARDGLHMQLDARVYATDTGAWRPAVAAYKAMLAVLDIYDARRVVFVGDSPTEDLQVAAAMGMRTVLVASPSSGPDGPDGPVTGFGGPGGPGPGFGAPGLGLGTPHVTPTSSVDAVVHSLAEIPGWVATWS